MTIELIPTRNPWTLYSHHLSNSDSYKTSYTKMCDVESFQDFGRMWNHTHPRLVGDPHRVVQIQGRRVTSWSFFKDRISPEWEHPANEQGITFTHRATMSSDVAYHLWETLVCHCVLSTHPTHLNGIQVSRKSSIVRHHEPGLLMKFDLWFSHDATLSEVASWVDSHLAGHKFTHAPRTQR